MVSVVMAMVSVVSISTQHDLRLRSASFAGQHERHEEDDDGTAHGGANELAWVGGGVLPRRF